MTLPLRPPLIVNHMAALDGQYPPNSLEAIRACLEAGAACVEIDITALADADYLLVHDPVLESETSGFGLVGACSVAQARALRIKTQGKVTEYHVPLLSEVVTLLLEYPNGARLQCDFKNVMPLPDAEPYERLVRLIEPLGERVIVSTGADWQLRRLRRITPTLDLGLDIGNNLDWHTPGELYDPRLPPWKCGAYEYWDDHPLASLRVWSTADYLADRCELLANSVAGLSTFYISHRFLVRSLEDGFNWAEALHARGIKLDAWTLDVTNPQAMANAKRLLEAGVDQFTTNTPRELAAALATM